MTVINVALRRTNDENELVPVKGWLRWTPTARLDLEGEIVLPVGFMENLVNGDQTVDVMPTTDEWFWTVEEHVRGIDVATRTVAVPEDGPVDYDDLVDIDPSTVGPQAPLKTWLRSLAIERERIDELINLVGDLTEGEAGDIQSVAGLSSTIITAAALKTALNLPADTQNDLLDEIALRMASDELLEVADQELDTRIDGVVASAVAQRSERAGYRVALLGASVTANNGDSTLVNNPTGGATAHGPVTLGIDTWANALLGQPFNIVTNVSRGGDTSAMILANVPAALAASPEYVFGHDWWQNDIVNNVPIATSKANITDIIDDCNTAGATVILTDYLPLAAFDTDAKIEQHFAMVDWLATQQDKGFMFVPVCDLIVDPATGLPHSWATYDGTHPSPRGARAIAEVFADRIGHLFQGRPSRQPVATNVYAGSGVKGNPKELIGNPMVRGNNGSGVALLYALSGSGQPTAVKIPATDYPSLEWQRIIFGADGTAILTPGVQSGAGLTYGALTMVPGTTRTRFGFEFRIPTVSASGKWACVTAYQYYTPASETYYALQDTNVAGQDQGFPADDNLIYQAQSKDALMPVGSTAIACGIVLYGQAGAIVDIRRVSLAVVN